MYLIQKVKEKDTILTHKIQERGDLTQKRGIEHFNMLWLLLTFVFAK